MLDAMPGKQMAIDADLNAGSDRRERGPPTPPCEVAREADFYGSMDGASKFVKGDAIAGDRHRGHQPARRHRRSAWSSTACGSGRRSTRFALLTVGDGLVSQIPALLISVASGVIVTRSVTDDDGGFGADLWGQLLQDRPAPSAWPPRRSVVVGPGARAPQGPVLHPRPAARSRRCGAAGGDRRRQEPTRRHAAAIPTATCGDRRSTSRSRCGSRPSSSSSRPTSWISSGRSAGQSARPGEDPATSPRPGARSGRPARADAVKRDASAVDLRDQRCTVWRRDAASHRRAGCWCWRRTPTTRSPASRRSSPSSACPHHGFPSTSVPSSRPAATA